MKNMEILSLKIEYKLGLNKTKKAKPFFYNDLAF